MRSSKPASSRSWLLIGLLLVAAAGLWAAGCASAARERLGLGLAPPVSVAMIVHGADDDPFWAEVNSGAVDAARAFDVNLLWRSTHVATKVHKSMHNIVCK